MSNPFAIAAVTATLSQLVGRVTEDPTLAGVSLTTRALDLARTDSSRQLNLFLYDVTPNGAWRNADLPVRSAEGDLVSQPVLALNLHYLLTAYGLNNDDVDAHHLLAHAMSLVNDNAVLTRDQIRASIRAQPAVGLSDLADQVELVKLSLHPTTIEELFKLWSTFQTQYRLSVAYEATVVLIERPHRPKAALPVHAANLYVLPIRLPLIETADPQILTAGQTLTIRGLNLRGDVVKVRFGLVPPVAPDSISDRSLVVTLPVGLPAGVNTVQVVHELNIGTPPAAHRGFESNVAAFILAPRITTPPPITVERGTTLVLSIEPSVMLSQRVALLVGDREIALPIPTPGSPPTGTLNIEIPSDFPTGNFLLRVRVDGAESPLEVDTNENSPTFNQYIGPMITIAP